MKKIITGLALGLVLASSALAAPKSGCCDASKCKTACCKVACCDAPCCAGAKGRATKIAKNLKKGKAVRAGACCAMPCCNGGACCGASCCG